METLRETRQNGHKDTKKKKELEKGSQKHYDKQDKMDIIKRHYQNEGKTFMETLTKTRKNGPKDTKKKNKKCSCKF